MNEFRIVAPSRISDVLDELSGDPEDAAVYAGGTELVVAMKHGLMAPRKLIDIKHVTELSEEFVATEDYLSVSAVATHLRIATSDVVNEHLPVLSEVAGCLGNARVRSVGTAIGNLCFGEPHSDVSTVTVLLGAELAIESAEGREWVSVEDFVVDAYDTILPGGCFVSRIRFPIARRARYYGYRRMKGAERPIASAGVYFEFGEDRVAAARISIGAVGPKALRLSAVEEHLVGTESSDLNSVLRDAAFEVASGVDAETDYDASEEFRRHLAGELFLRAADDAVRHYRERM